MPATNNYYKQLGVPRNASAETIEEAWKLWKRDPNNHPDTHPDLNVKARVESEFQQRSAAYLVLSNPVDRRKHDADLRSRDAATKAASASASYATPDPGSEDADWGGGPAAGKPPTPNYSPPTGHYSPTSGKSFPYGQFFKYSGFLLAAIVAIMVVMFFVQRAANPTASTGGSTGSLVPQTTPPVNSVASSETPSPTPEITASPTATPNLCPVGSPIISVINSTISGQGLATVLGEIRNPTSAEVEIGNIGFYLGAIQTGTPPSWTDTLASSNMVVAPSFTNPNDIPAGSSVSYTESFALPTGSTYTGPINATLEYPATPTSGRATNWSWIGNISGCASNTQ